MLENLLKKAVDELRRRESARDAVLGRARRIRLISKQAILSSHNQNYEKAGDLLIEAKNLLKEIRPHLESYPEINFYEEMEAAYQEYAESVIIHSLLTISEYPSLDFSNVDVFSYILGLADVPGELKREAFDALRRDDLDLAEQHLATMEEIYLNLLSVEETSLLLKGLRRKLDVTRNVIESTRAEVTSEIGRRRLIKTIKALSDRLNPEDL